MKLFIRGMCLALSCAALSVSGSSVFTTLHGFLVFPKGAQPETPLIQARDGNFYGATLNGGTNGGFGTIFRLSASGVATTLYTFSGGSDGASPSGNLVQATDGNLYGTTQGGGDATSDGTIFRMTTNGAFTSLYQFTGGSDGGIPMSGLILGADGSLYGTAQSGGDVNLDGTIFQITTGGTFTLLYTFTGGSDGSGPSSALIQGVDGNLYGTAQFGGDNGDGTIFQVSTNGSFNPLHQFAETPDGSGPTAALVQGVDGNLYGTTQFGGDTNDDGTIFQVNTNIASIEYNNLYTFTNGVDGSGPAAGLIQDTNGLLYGTANSGGVNGQGTIFQITTNGAFATMHAFAGGSDGANPIATLLRAGDGQLYGTTADGNTNGAGIVFRISTASAYAPFFLFPGVNDGGLPSADMILGKDGNYYGTTEGGGQFDDGVIFRATPAGTITVLYSFGTITNSDGSPADGTSIEGGVVQGSDGTLYGTASGGGANGDGTIYSLTTNGLFTVLHDFSLFDGAGPADNLLFGKDGNLYGTTVGGGDVAGDGTMFRITTNGSFTELLPLDPLDGSPNGSLVQGPDGNLYGTAFGNSQPGAPVYGTVFQVTTNPVTFTILYSFADDINGGNPEAGLALGTDGFFYGTTTSGGVFGDGTVFKISSTNLTTLAQFDGTNGSLCTAPLTLGKDGNFYGTTLSGGDANGDGTLFQVTPAGVLTTLYLFNGTNDGFGPDNALISGGNGVFYGAVENAGPGGNGTFFRLDLTPYLQPISKTGSTLNISWVSVPGLEYELEYRTNLNLGNWVNLGGTNVATNSIMEVTDTIGPNARRFYRAALLP